MVVMNSAVENFYVVAVLTIDGMRPNNIITSWNIDLPIVMHVVVVHYLHSSF